MLMQFDDIVQVSVSANDGSTFTEDPDDRHTANSTLSKKAARKAGVVKVGPTPAINWDVKMRDMKRLVCCARYDSVVVGYDIRKSRFVIKAQHADQGRRRRAAILGLNQEHKQIKLYC